MEKFFNTAGPIRPELHYHISSFERIDWDEFQMLIASQKYFLLHVPRQTGKTTALLEMMHLLNKEGAYRVLYVNIETAQTARNDVERGIATVCSAFTANASFYLQDSSPAQWLKSEGSAIPADDRFGQLLRNWAGTSDLPTVLLLDEVDALVGDTLISLLRQIRSGYTQRPTAFPQSIILCGLRDIKDYRIHRSDGEVITGGSAFNIKAESLRLGNFTADEVENLFRQNTAASGQTFDAAIFPELWEDTTGQPWLVNALGHEMTWKDKSARDRNTPITLARYQAARERLIRSRATHLDQLADKLREPRVHKVISALLQGTETLEITSSDDQSYVEDLGLIVSRPQLRIANRIYREIVPREMTAALSPKAGLSRRHPGT